MPSKKTRKQAVKKDTPKTHITKKPVFYFFAVIIIVIITISFLGGPLLSQWMSRTNKLVFGEYAGKEIAFVPSISNYFFQRYRVHDAQFDYMMDLYKNYFENLSEEETQAIINQEGQKKWANSFNDTILHMAIMHELEKSGIIITEDRIIKSFFEFGPYIDENKNYSSDLYKVTNNADRIEYQEIQLEQISDGQYNEDIKTAAALGISDKEKEFIMNMGVSERKYSIVSYDFDDYPLEEILAYAGENLEKFQKIQLSRITITSSKEDAEQIRERANNEEMSFEDLARAYSDVSDYYRDIGGDMGWQYYYDLYFIFNSEETVKSILNLPQDKISDVYEIELESAKSWVFYRANSYVDDPDLSDPDLITEIKEYISYYDQNIIEMYFMELAEEFKIKAEEDGFLQASLEYNLFPPIETNYFPINYGTIFQNKSITVNDEVPEELSSAANNEYFYEVLFALELDEISEPIVLSDNLIVVQMSGERNAPEEDLENLENSLTNIKQNTMTRDLSQIVIVQELLVNRFYETMQRMLNQQN
jgi:hypothetical protein